MKKRVLALILAVILLMPIGDWGIPGYTRAEEEAESIEHFCTSVEELESEHEYANDLYEVWHYTLEGAKNLAVTFDEKTCVEEGDYIRLYSGSDERIGSYSGSVLAGGTVYIPGDTVKIVLDSDEGETAWGFAVSDVNSVENIPEKSGGIEYVCTSLEELNQRLSNTDGYNYKCTYVYTLEGAENLKITFDEETRLERYYYGNIRILDKYNNVLTAFEGYDTLGSVVFVAGDTVKFEVDATWSCGVKSIESTAQCENFAYTVSSNNTVTIRKYTGNQTMVKVPSEIEGMPVKRIGVAAFYDCNVTSVILPDEIQSIDSRAFYGCNLTSIYIPNSVTSIGEYAFGYCDLRDVNLPEGLLTIGAGIFYHCNGLTSITLPEGVTEIGEHAFSGCENLTSITLPEGVTEIGRAAFWRCENLTSITLPQTLKEIGTQAFAHCLKLEEIILPDGLESVSQSVLQATAYYENQSNWVDGVLYSGAVLLEADEKVTSCDVREGTCLIADFAFSDCRYLRNITLSNGLKNIGYGCFSHCESLEEIVIPEGIQHLPDHVFMECTNLTRVVLPESLETIGDNVDTDDYYNSGATFLNCTKLKEINLPKSVTRIGAKTFRSCESLQYVVLPDGLKEIGEFAFDGCTALQSIKLPDGLNYIGKSAFNETTFLDKECVWEDGALYYGPYLIKADESLETCVVKDGTTVIAGGAFAGNSNLSSVTLPESLIAIGAEAFADCTALGSASFPKNLKEIGKDAFEFCTSLEAVEIPEGITELKCGVFQYCSNLVSVTLPRSLESIGQNCSWVFTGCEKLSEINIPEGIKSIAHDEFSGCESLISITLPRSLNYIGGHCFEGSGLKRILYLGTEREWFEMLASSANIVVSSFWGDFCAYGEPYCIGYDFLYAAGYNGMVAFRSFGDINGDAEITSDDAVYLLNYTLFPELYPLSCSADFDRDEKITSDDAVYLLNYTLFPDIYPLEE